MLIRSRVRINAPMKIVWEVFSDLSGWDSWNPVCLKCRLEQGSGLEAGARFSFSLRPFAFPLRIAPIVVEALPEKRVVWKGSRLGIRAVHTFEFQEHPAYSEIVSLEKFAGPMLLPARLVGATRRLHLLSEKLLESIRAESECRAAKKR